MKTQARKEYEKQWRKNNRERVNATARDYYHKNLEENRRKKREYVATRKHIETARQRKNHLKRKYGITDTDYQIMLSNQDGRCKICDTDEPGGRGSYFHIDHHHEDGDIRGLLCSRCNLVLGLIDDNTEILFGMVRYLDPPIEGFFCPKCGTVYSDEIGMGCLGCE